jgi:hypothetical protein
MPQLVTLGATLTCTFGMAPSMLSVLPSSMGMAENKPIASIMDFKPMINIPPFGMCMTPSNPTVAAATSAAMGVLTPMPCIPVIVSPWVPGAPAVLVGNVPALTAVSTCMCTWGGVISIVQPGQLTVNTK